MNSYASLNDLKSYGVLNLKTNDADSVLLSQLEEGSREFDKDTDRFFYIYEGTYFQDFGASQRLILDWDVQSISTCYLDTAGDNAYSTQMVVDIATTATTPPDAFAYPVNVYPKTRLEINPWGSVGHFAAGIRKAVKITGTFGYGNDWPASNLASIGTITSTSSFASTSSLLPVDAGEPFSAGQTLRVNSEQMYVYSNPVGLTVPVHRAVNGTVAGTATTGDVVSVYQYPRTVTHAVIIYAIRAWQRRMSGYANVIGNPITGEMQVWKGKDPDYQAAVVSYRKVRRGYYL